jgi:hypothetical protein
MLLRVGLKSLRSHKEDTMFETPIPHEGEPKVAETITAAAERGLHYLDEEELDLIKAHRNEKAARTAERSKHIHLAVAAAFDGTWREQVVHIPGWPGTAIIAQKLEQALIRLNVIKETA